MKTTPLLQPMRSAIDFLISAFSESHLYLRIATRGWLLAATSLTAAHLTIASVDAATIYWDGTGAASGWGSVPAWSTSAAGTTPDPAAVPGAADVASFSISSVIGPQTVNLNANRSAAGLIFASTTATLLQGGGTNRTLTLGGSGIVVNAGAGSVTIGSSNGGQNVAVTVSTTQSWTNNSSAQLVIQNSISLSSSLSVGGSGNTIVNGAFTNSGGLIKNGSGNLTLAGANTYTGATAVGAGRLLVNGSIGASSAVTVNNGGTLGGSGTINSPVVVAPLGRLAPAVAVASMNTLTVNNSLSLALSCGLNYNLGSAGTPGGGDLVAGVSNLVLQSGLCYLDVAALPGFGSGTYDLFAVASGGTITDNGMTFVISGPAAYNYAVLFPGDAIDPVAGGGVVPPNRVRLQVTAAAPPCYFRAEYFNNADLTDLVLVRDDSLIDFNWSGVSPDSRIASDTFSVRWSGRVRPTFTETYTFSAASDDGVRLWVNGVLLIDQWTPHGLTTFSNTIALTAGRTYEIKMEYYQGNGAAEAHLRWASASQPLELVPPACGGCSGSGRTLVWTGAFNGTWDIGITPNWSFGGAATTYADGDTVNFDNSAVNKTVSIADTGVSPCVINVSNSAGTYTMNGPGAVWGQTTVNKLGNGTLVMSCPQS